MKMFYGGQWRDAAKKIEVKNPFDGSTVDTVPSATIDDFYIHDGYQHLVASFAGSGCLHGRWVFGCARREVGALSISTSNADVVPQRTVSFGVGHRFGGEWVLTPGLALRAYADVLVRHASGLSREGATRRILWPGSVLSVSLGLGPVFSFSTF